MEIVKFQGFQALQLTLRRPTWCPCGSKTNCPGSRFRRGRNMRLCGMKHDPPRCPGEVGRSYTAGSSLGERRRESQSKVSMVIIHKTGRRDAWNPRSRPCRRVFPRRNFKPLNALAPNRRWPSLARLRAHWGNAYGITSPQNGRLRAPTNYICCG